METIEQSMCKVVHHPLATATYSIKWNLIGHGRVQIDSSLHKSILLAAKTIKDQSLEVSYS